MNDQDKETIHEYRDRIYRETGFYPADVYFRGGRSPGKTTASQLMEEYRCHVAEGFQAMIDEAREELRQAGLTAEDANTAIEAQLTKLANLNFWSKQP